MKKFISLLAVLVLSTMAFADDGDVPLPGPGGPDDPGHQQPAPAPAPPRQQPPAPAPRPGNPPQNPGQGQEVVYSLGEVQTKRFGAKDYAFYPRWDVSALTMLRLVGVNNKVNIQEVTVYYADNNEIQVLPILEGTLHEGDVAYAYLPGRKVFKVVVSANSGTVFKSAGAFRAEATAIQQ